MKGNQGKRGAVSKRSQSKAPQKGSGRQNRRGLAGRGATPKAEDRTWHPAHEQKLAKEAKEKQQQARTKAAMKTKVKAREGGELVLGRNPVIEAAAAGLVVRQAFIATDPAYGRMDDVVSALAATGTKFVEVTKRDLDRAADGAAHQGVAIEVEAYDYLDLDELLTDANQQRDPGLLLALDHITDPHNLGAVIRSAAAFGANGVILPTRRSAGISPVVWKVSAGAVAHVPAARVPNLVQALKRCKDDGYFVVGLDGNANTSLPELNLADQPLVIVTGAEGRGLSRLVRETCDLIVSIPISRDVESLNAAVATGITLYQVAEFREAAR